MAERKRRIYEVLAVATDRGDPVWKPHLVEATSPAAAREHMAAKYVGAVSLADGLRVAALMVGGVKVEVAGEGA